MTRLRLGALRVLVTMIGASTALLAQHGTLIDPTTPRGQFQENSSSEIRYLIKGGDKVVEIKNTTYELTGPQVPGRPPDERLVLRKAVQSTEILDNVGVDATTTVEAWRLGFHLKGKPLYRIQISGTNSRTVDNALLEVSRGLEEVDWWSVYKLGTGQHLFDTYVPLVSFSISREALIMRYVGLEVPPDDAADSRLREPHVVGVLTYASGDGLIREALMTADSADQAASLRSYADETRLITVTETAPNAKFGEQARDLSLAINISFSQSYPSPAATITAVIPLAGDDLDLARAQLPPGLHIVKWKR